MQSHHECKGNKLNSLEELLAAFKLMQAAKPLARSQSELAMAAVLNASNVVGGRLPQSAAPVHKHPKVRASSLPIGIPSYAPATPPTIARSPVQDVPLYQSRVNGTLTKPNVQIASPQSDRPPIKTCLYKVCTVHLVTCPTFDQLLACSSSTSNLGTLKLADGQQLATSCNCLACTLDCNSSATLSTWLDFRCKTV